MVFLSIFYVLGFVLFCFVLRVLCGFIHLTLSTVKLCNYYTYFYRRCNIGTKSVGSLPKAMGSKLKNQKLNLALSWKLHFRSDQIRSVAQSCPTLCDPMNRSTSGLPVHHQLPEFTETHVHRVSDAIRPSHPLSAPSPPDPDPSQHQSLFQWVNSSHEVAKVLEFQLQHHSFQRNPRADVLQNGQVGSPCSPRDSQELLLNIAFIRAIKENMKVA